VLNVVCTGEIFMLCVTVTNFVHSSEIISCVLRREILCEEVRFVLCYGGK
jgi:hypothetical protein